MKSVSGRMETKKLSLKKGAEVTVIKDCYNANPDSMEKLLDFIYKLETGGKKFLVLADMKELGAASFDAHKNLGSNIFCFSSIIFLFKSEFVSELFWLF